MDGEFPDIVEAQPEVLAHHYTEAGLSELAVTFWQRAGERARSHAADDDYRLFRVLIGLYRCLGVRNEYQAREEAVEALVEVAQRVQDPHLLLEAHMVQANIAMLAGAYREARNHWFDTADLKNAKALLIELEK